MTQSIVAKAFNLYLETADLSTMDADDARFYELYEKECQLFDLMRKFTPEESKEYRELVGSDESSEDFQWEYMNGEYPEDF